METNVTPLNNPINNIGIVKGYNKDTREVAVYMPKFMPGIVETKSIEAKTKYEGTIISDIPYSPTIKTSPYVWAAAKDMSNKLPKVGSKVIISYIDNNPELMYWEPFNPDGDYDVIDDEKYSRVNYLNINGQEVPIYQDDILTVNLPDGYRSVVLKNNKTITLNIIPESEDSFTIADLKKRVGDYSTYKTSDGKQVISIEGSGLSREIEKIKDLIGGAISIKSFEKLDIDAGAVLGENTYIKTSLGAYQSVDAGTIAEKGVEYYSANIKNSTEGIVGAVVALNKRFMKAIPNPPDGDGNYSLQCKITGGVPVYTWTKIS